MTARYFDGVSEARSLYFYDVLRHEIHIFMSRHNFKSIPQETLSTPQPRLN